MDNHSNIYPPPDASALILDLLVALAPRWLSTQAFVRAGELVSLSSIAVRTALTRLKHDGRVISPERGLYRLGDTPDPWRRRVDGWRSILVQLQPWDGSWLMAAIRPTSGTRTEWRHTHRALDIEGFKQMPEGFWLRPDNLVGGLDACRARLEQFGLARGLTARISALDSVSSSTAASLWDVEAMDRQRIDLIDAIRTSHDRLEHLALGAAAREGLLIGRAGVRAIVRDPLLPASWKGGESLAPLVESMLAYESAAKEIWQRYLKIGEIEA